MLRSASRTAILLAALGLLGVAWGDPQLLRTGNYRFVLFIWITQALFWLAYLLVVTPLFLILARGGRRKEGHGGRRKEGDDTLAALLVGFAGLALVLGASVYYLHNNLGFFAPHLLPIKIAACVVAVAAAILPFRALGAWVPSLHRRRILITLAGVAVSAGFWVTMALLSWPSRVELGVESLNLSTQPRNRILLLGLDGADWLMIDPLIKAGGLPSFARLREHGVTAPMETVSSFSPVDWTSIATGMAPVRHSVQYFSEMYWPDLDMTAQRLNLSFLEPLYSRVFQKIPVSSTTRTSKAIWEILSAFDRASLVIDWWATFPAEPQRGVMISNYAMPWDEISPARIARLVDASHRVYPEEIWPEVLAVMQDAVKDGLVVSAGEGVPLESKVTNTRFWDARDQIGINLFDRFDAPGLAFRALYLQGIDTTSHNLSEAVFGPNMDLKREPSARPEVVAEKQAMVKAVYEKMDLLIGRLMGRMTEGELLVVVSDHGWRYDGTSHWRLPDAIFALYGSGVREGVSPGRVHIYDVMPTLLYYLGLPLSREMPGKAIEAAFTPEAVALLPKVFVPSYGPRVRPLRVSDPEIDGDYKKKLKPLGYVQ